MPLLLILNELSYRESRAGRESISDAIHELIQLIRRIRRHRDHSVLVTEAGLFDLELASGYTMRSWAADGRNRDALRYLKSVRQRAPFQGIAPRDQANSVEYRHRKRLAEGLGLAHLVGGLGVSLALDPDWSTPSLALDRTMLEEDEAEEPLLVESSVELRHASATEHVATHQRWLCEEGFTHVHTGAELWRLRADVLPNLVLLPRVEQHLVALEPHWVRPVKERLTELQDVTARWDTAHMAAPAWASHATGESASRRDLCRFTDLDGTMQLFEMHARFTPGAGRIYFRLDRAAQTLVVAHIGRKLL